MPKRWAAALVAVAESVAPGLLAAAGLDDPSELTADHIVRRNSEGAVKLLAPELARRKVTINAVPDRPGVAVAIFDPLADAGINVDMIVQNVGHGGATDLSFTIPRVELAKADRKSVV